MSSPIKPITSSTVGIEDLPPEMICTLFEHLIAEGSLKDLIACSMVNKRWHSIYAAFKLHRLVLTTPCVTESDYDPFYELVKWSYSDRRIEEAERCSPAMFIRLAEKPLLSNLRQLALCGDDLDFDLNELNHFQQLVHLEIVTHLAGEVRLNLPRLRVLAFHIYNDLCRLSIDCPLLSTLAYHAKTEHANLLDVKHPETIRRLETNSFGSELARFKSVECLVTYQCGAISEATLLSLPELRELHHIQDIECLLKYEFDNEVGTIDQVKRKLSKFVNEAKKLRGSVFRFTFSGFQLTNVNVDQIDFGVQVNEDETHESEYVCNEYIYMKNYHLIEPGALHFIRRVDYTRLLSHVTGEFPRCFSQKFTGIEEVEVTDVVKDPDHLLWFLKSLRFLRELELRNVKLSQEFYDQLPAAIR